MAECKRAQIFCIKLDGSESVPFIMKKDRLLVGRGDSCEIRVHVDGVASEHCAITMDQEGRAYLEPLDNCGLTFLNNSVIAEKILLEHNDMFKVVTRSFRFAYPETSAYFKTVTETDMKKGNKESSRYEIKSMVKSLIKNDNSSPSAALVDMKIRERKQLLFRRQSLPNTAKLSLYKKCQHSLRSSQKSQASFSKRSSYVGFQKNSVKREKLEESATKKRVTFGPRLSPEEFDKNLPPASPLRRGSLPSASPFDPNMLKYQTDFESKKVHGIKRPCENYSVSSPRRRLEFTSPVAPKPILKESEAKKNCDLSPHLLRENKQRQKVPLFSEVLKKPANSDNYAVKRIDKKIPFEKRCRKVKKMVLRSQVLCNKSPRQAFHQRVLGVTSTGHANSPATIFICKKKTGTANNELSAKKIQGENPTQHVPSEFTPSRNKKCKGKDKTLTENEVIPSPEACQLGRSSGMNHVGPEDLRETKSKDISVPKRKSPMKEITDNYVLENKRSFEEININFEACSSVGQVTEPKRNSRNDFNCEEVPFSPVIMDASNLSTPKCLPKKKNSFPRKSLNEKIHSGKDSLAENCKTVIVTDGKCNKLSDDKILKVVDEAVQSSVCHEETNKEKDLLSKNCGTVIVTESECNKLNDDKSLKVVDKAVQSCSVCDEKTDTEKNLLLENCETVVSDSECNRLNDDKALKVVDKAVQSCSVCNEKANKEKDLLAENCETDVTDSECNKLSDDKALEVIDKAVQSCSVCPKFGSNFLLNDSCTSTENLLRKLIFKVSMLNAFELYKQIIHNRDFFLKAIPHLCTPENTEEFDKRHPINTWKEFLEQIEGFENQKLLEGMLQVSCLQSPFHELFPSISSTFKPGEVDGDKKSTSVMKYNQGHSQEQLLLNSMACSERMICSSTVKLQEPNIIDSFGGNAVCSKISSDSGTDNKTPEKSSNENEEKKQYCLQNNKCVPESCQSPSSVHESAPKHRTLRSRVLNESVDTRDTFKKLVRKQNSIEECTISTLISSDTKEKECSESHKFFEGKLSASCDKHLESFKNQSASEKDTKKKRTVNRLRQSLLVKRPVSYRTRLQRSKENGKSTEMVNSMLFVKAGESSGSATSETDLNEIKHVAKKRVRKNKNLSRVTAAKTVNKRETVFKSEAHLTDDKIKCVADVETTNSFETNESPVASGVDHNHILPSQKKARKRRVMTEASTENRSEMKKDLKTENMVDGNTKCVTVTKTVNSPKPYESPVASGVDHNHILPSQKKARKRRVMTEASTENRSEMKKDLKTENMVDGNTKSVTVTETVNSPKPYESPVASGVNHNHILPSQKKIRSRRVMTKASTEQNRSKKKKALKAKNVVDDNIKCGAVNSPKPCESPAAPGVYPDQIILPPQKKTRRRKVIVEAFKEQNRNEKENSLKNEENMLDDNIKCIENSEAMNSHKLYGTSEVSETDLNQIVLSSKKRRRKDAAETSERKTKSIVLSSKKRKRKDAAETSERKTKSRKKIVTGKEGDLVCANTEQSGISKNVEVKKYPGSSEAHLEQTALPSKMRTRQVTSKTSIAKTKSTKKNAIKIEGNLNDVGHSKLTKDTAFLDSVELFETDAKDIVFPSKNRKRKDAPETTETKTKTRKIRKENSISVSAEVTKDVEIYENFEASETGLNQITLQKKGKRKNISEIPKAELKSKKRNVTRVRENQNNVNIKQSEITKDIEVSESCVQDGRNLKISFSKQKNEKVCHFPSTSVTTRSMVK